MKQHQKARSGHMLLFYMFDHKKVSALIRAATDRGEEQDSCPSCGGTELFDGFGTCRMCDLV